MPLRRRYPSQHTPLCQQRPCGKSRLPPPRDDNEVPLPYLTGLVSEEASWELGLLPLLRSNEFTSLEWETVGNSHKVPFLLSARITAETLQRLNSYSCSERKISFLPPPGFHLHSHWQKGCAPSAPRRGQCEKRPSEIQDLNNIQNLLISQMSRFQLKIIPRTGSQLE